MRITKKFAGASCIGKVVFQPCEQGLSQDIDERESENLRILEKLFLIKLYGKNFMNGVGGGGIGWSHGSGGGESNIAGDDSYNTSNKKFKIDGDAGIKGSFTRSSSSDLRALG